MKRSTNLGARARRMGFCVITVAALLAGELAHGQSGGSTDAGGSWPLRTQLIQLQRGWNAVYLEVEPLDSEPAQVFRGLPVEVVARYFQPVTAAEFLTDPVDEPWKRPGWGVWYAPSRADAFLTSLGRVHGREAYLIRATADVTWSVEGRVEYKRLEWKTDQFNLTGLPVDPANAPTFAQFFAGAEGKAGQRVYQLVQGRWAQVTDLAATPVRAGEAYWIFNAGRPDYQGPLDVRLGAAGALDFGARATDLPLTYLAAAGVPATVTVEVIPAGSTAAAGLPLREVVVDLAGQTTSYPALAATRQLPAVAPGYASALRLQVRREEMDQPEMTALLKLTSSSGVQAWVPVRARKK